MVTGQPSHERDFFSAPAEALLAAAVGGEPKAIAVLLERYEPLLISSVRKHLGRRRFQVEGDDLLQGLRISLVQSLPSVQSREMPAFSAWLKMLIQSRILDWEKRRRRKKRNSGRPPLSLEATGAPEVAAKTPTPSRILLTKEEKTLLRRAIDNVPLRYRAVLQLICEKDPNLGEIAAFLDKEKQASRKFVARALQHLRQALGPEGASTWHKFL